MELITPVSCSCGSSTLGSFTGTLSLLRSGDLVFTCWDSTDIIVIRAAAFCNAVGLCNFGVITSSEATKKHNISENTLVGDRLLRCIDKYRNFLTIDISIFFFSIHRNVEKYRPTNLVVSTTVNRIHGLEILHKNNTSDYYVGIGFCKNMGPIYFQSTMQVISSLIKCSRYARTT